MLYDIFADKQRGYSPFTNLGVMLNHITETPILLDIQNISINATNISVINAVTRKQRKLLDTIQSWEHMNSSWILQHHMGSIEVIDTISSDIYI